jgi:hypothetical protein
MFKQTYTLTTAFFCGMVIESGDYFIASVCLIAGVVGWWILSDHEQD